MTFEEASMPEYVLKEVLKQGFDKREPTPGCVYLPLSFPNAHLIYPYFLSDSHPVSGLAHGAPWT
jgi:hypothetical protein